MPERKRLTLAAALILKQVARALDDKDRGAVVERVDRRYFELCVFSNVMLELKSGDLCVPGSDQFSDYRKELVSKDEFERGVALYGEQAGIPVEGPLFIARLRGQIEAAAKRANDNFPANEYLRQSRLDSAICVFLPDPYRSPRLVIRQSNSRLEITHFPASKTGRGTLAFSGDSHSPVIWVLAALVP